MDINSILPRMRSSSYNFQFEIKKPRHGRKFLYNNFPKIYIQQRDNLILIIKKVSQKLKLTEQTFYQATLYLDVIFSNQHTEITEEKLKLAAVSCLILAGIIIKNLIKKFK